MLTKKTIGFLGSGNLAEALIKGLISSGMVSPGQIIAGDKDSQRLLYMAEAYEVKVFSKNHEVARSADIILLTVKPDTLDDVLTEVAREITPDKLVVSAVAGKTVAAIQDALIRGGIHRPVPIIRAMPNTPALIGEGATALYAEEGVGEERLRLACAIMGAVGDVVVLEDESLMDAVTGLSGSGPAYIFLFMNALINAGVKAGIPRDIAKRLVLKTTAGAANLARKSGKELTDLIEMVASPGGTTVEGLRVFEEAGLASIVADAVDRAAKRAKELSGMGR